MRILIAPDSFKGTLASVEVAEALAAGWRQIRPADVIELAPLADGGEGTLAAIAATGDWERRVARARDPLGRWIDAPWLLSADRRTAVVEMAAASGLSRLTAAELDPVGATSAGTGDLLRAALDGGARHIILGIGGSATTDGGRGIVEALGARTSHLGSSGRSGSTSGSAPGDGVEVDLSTLDPRLAEATLDVACDVSNPLLGPHGAAATYGPQKGANPADVDALDARNARWADGLEAASGRAARDLPGAGAAGGVGFAMLAIAGRFGSFGLRPGIELVMEAVGFDARVALADLVITGEGRIDAQTAFGKTALGVARLARAAGVRCVAVGGGVEPAGVAALAALSAAVMPVWERPVALAEAMAAGAAPLVRCGARMAAMETATGATAASAPAPPLSTPPRKTTGPKRPATKRKKRRKPDPVKAWVRRLERTRPNLVRDVLDGLATIHGHPAWERRLDPTSELILTILTQNSADINAEKAFEALRAAYPSGLPVQRHIPGPGWGGEGLADGAPPDWDAVERAPFEELVEVIRPGGLPNQKARGIHATLRAIRERRGDHSLEFLADLPALEARDWLVSIPGIGKKTASVLLMFSFGMPLMAVDRHVERVSQRVGLLPKKASADDAHDYFLAMLEPGDVYEAHVNLIRHGRLICQARSPKHDLCPLRTRCRFVDPKAP
jgi:glycerate kinase